MADGLKGLDAWIARLADSEAVALGTTISDLNELTASDETSVNELASVILRDPALTTKVLRTANSAYFNPGGPPISTISRGIFQLGFSTIRSICLTAIMLETLLKEHPRERLLEVLAQSFHSAVQARNLCKNLAPEMREEVFVAALLFRVGELLIWASSDKVVDRLQIIYKESRDIKAVEEALGVSFERLTKGVAGHWRLGKTLNEALNPGTTASRKVVAVIMGDRISKTVRQGMRSEEMGKLLKKISHFMVIPEQEVRDQVLAGVEEASELTHSFGGRQLGQLIGGKNTGFDAFDDAGNAEGRVNPDPKVQLQILQEITLMVQQKLDTNMLFQMIIEGLHRGVGFERVALAIFDQKRTQISAKFILGEGTLDWRDRFRFSFERKPNNFFQRVIERNETCWIGHPNFADLEKLRTPEINNIISQGEFLICPIIVDRKEVGFLYADINVSARPLSSEYLNGFKHFAQQTVICLGVLARRGG